MVGPGIGRRRLEPPRSRACYAALTALTIALGLFSRRVPALPAWLAKDIGDALYATMTFWLAGLLVPALPTRRTALGAVLFCYAVEASQLYHAPWIDALRGTLLGGLALGHGFHARDLVCYAVGVLLGAGIERAARPRCEPAQPRARRPKPD